MLLIVSAAVLPAWFPSVSAQGNFAQEQQHSTTIDVRDKGAKGDGKHDDTLAFQSAIDSLPADGGTVVVPPGHYLIDALRSVNLRSNMVLQLAPDATLVAIPNNSPRSNIVKVWNANNVRIRGGRIVGERNGHTGEGGEWGYGLNIEASHHVHVSDMHISDCWGDGIWIGAIGPYGNAVPATDVTIDHVVSDNNRRQGLSIGPVDGLVITNSTFSDTHGTMPQAGIDIEPMGQGPARNITIDHCLVMNNRGSGVEIHDNVSGVVIKHSTIRDNFGYGLLQVDGPTRLSFIDNVITGNGLVGLAIEGQTKHVKAAGNTLRGNSSRYVRRIVAEIASLGDGPQAGELRIAPTTSDITISETRF